MAFRWHSSEEALVKGFHSSAAKSLPPAIFQDVSDPKEASNKKEGEEPVAPAETPVQEPKKARLFDLAFERGKAKSAARRALSAVEEKVHEGVTQAVEAVAAVEEFKAAEEFADVMPVLQCRIAASQKWLEALETLPV